MQRYKNERDKAIPQKHHLSDREMEVSYYIAWGYSDKEIARQLNLSFYTIRTHRSNILTKTGCRNAADITRWYFEQTKGIEFGIKPTLTKILAIASLLFLIFISELYNHHQMIRTRNITVARRTKTEKSGKRKKQTYKISA